MHHLTLLIFDPMEASDIDTTLDVSLKRPREDDKYQELQHPDCMFAALLYWHTVSVVDSLCLQVFVQNFQGHYRCILCKNHNFQPISEAIQHKYRHYHIQNVRKWEHGPTQLSSPLKSAKDDSRLGSLPPNEQIEAISDIMLYEEPLPSYRDHAPLGDIAHVPTRSLGAAVEHPGPGNHFYYPSDLRTIHGPALEDDDKNQLYDNWGRGLEGTTGEDPDGDLYDSDMDIPGSSSHLDGFLPPQPEYNQATTQCVDAWSVVGDDPLSGEDSDAYRHEHEGELSSLLMNRAHFKTNLVHCSL